jgi:RNA-directed DNA polymerase
MLVNANHKIIRYADDFVILCKTETEAREVLEIVRQWMRENQLTLHPDKTHIGNCLEEGHGFEFLGYRFEAGKKLVRKKSMKKLRDAIRAKTKRSSGKSINKIIEDLNPTLRGWFEYFKHAHRMTLPSIDGFVRRRLRLILRRQNKRGRGTGRNLNDHMRWPNQYFANLGLFTIRQALECACRSR